MIYIILKLYFIWNLLIYKKRIIINIGYYLYGIRNQLLVINCDKLLFLKKYKNIYDIIHLKINDVRIYPFISILLKFRIKHIKNGIKKYRKTKIYKFKK